MGNTRILIDPWFGDLAAPGVVASSPPPALGPGRVGELDVLVVTQNAPDRIDARSLKALKGRAASCFVPDDATAALFRRQGFTRVRVVAPGDRFGVRGGDVLFSPAPDGLFGAPQIGAHFTIAKRTLWHTGVLPPLFVDDSAARFARSHPAEVVLASAGGWNVGDRAAYMSEGDAVALAALANARYVVPHSTDVVPSFVGHLFLSKRKERRPEPLAFGPDLYRAVRGRWTEVSRKRAPVDRPFPTALDR